MATVGRAWERPAAYALALKTLTGVEMEKMLPTPNIDLMRIPECQKYLNEGSRRRLYRFSPEDYKEAAGVRSNDEVALPGDPPGNLEVVEGLPDGSKIPASPGLIPTGVKIDLPPAPSLRGRLAEAPRVPWQTPAAWLWIATPPEAAHELRRKCRSPSTSGRGNFITRLPTTISRASPSIVRTGRFNGSYGAAAADGVSQREAALV